MEIKKVISVVFSPTESTQKVVSFIQDKCAGVHHVTAQGKGDMERVDLTLPQKEGMCHSFAKDDCVVFGVPVYGGRIPAVAVERLKNIHGNHTPAILIVTYGNRDYEDALLELQDVTEKNGFVAIAGAAIVTEHSIMHSVAAGRPDNLDKEKINHFSQQVFQMLENISDVSGCAHLSIKGNKPYVEYHGIPLKPGSSKACTKCGICSLNCPVGAIPSEKPDEVKTDICISCMRCVKVCPVHARKLNKGMLFVAESAFAKKNKDRKEPEFFIYDKCAGLPVHLVYGSETQENV